MALFRKKISVEKFADLLVELLERIRKQDLEFFNDELRWIDSDDNLITLESLFFSMWTVIISLGPGNYKLKDLFHEKYFEDKKKSTKNYILERISVRYEIYNEAYFNYMDNKDHLLFGGTIGNVIKNTKNYHKRPPRFGPKSGIDIINSSLIANLFADNHSYIDKLFKEFNKECKLNKILTFL